MSKYCIEKAFEKDNLELNKLCRVPMLGEISISFERNPNYFSGTRIQNEQWTVYICRIEDTSEIVATFSIGQRKVFLDDKIKSVGYLSDLRVAQSCQGSSVLFRIYDYINRNKLIKGAFSQTMIFSSNSVMISLIDKLATSTLKKEGFKYYFSGSYKSYMVSLNRHRSYKQDPIYNIRNATNSDINIMQHFLNKEGKQKAFYPVYDFSQLDKPYYLNLNIANYYLSFKGDELVGITGVWDQKKIKQTKISNYSRRLKILRPILNLFSNFSGAFILPKIGGSLNYFSLHTILIKKDDPKIFEGLLQEISNNHRKKDYSYFLCGLDERDKLNKSFNFIKKKKIVLGKHYLVANQKPKEEFLNAIFYMEVSRI